MSQDDQDEQWSIGTPNSRSDAKSHSSLPSYDSQSTVPFNEPVSAAQAHPLDYLEWPEQPGTDSPGQYAFLGVSLSDDDTGELDYLFVLFRWSSKHLCTQRLGRGVDTLIEEFPNRVDKRVSVYLGRPVTVRSLQSSPAFNSQVSQLTDPHCPCCVRAFTHVIFCLCFCSCGSSCFHRVCSRQSKPQTGRNA